MVREAFTKTAVRKITQALRSYASESGLRESDYRLLFQLDPEWGGVGVVFAVKPGMLKASPDPWFAMKHHLNRALADDPEVARAINLRVEDDSEDNVFMKLFDERFSPPEELLTGLPAN